MAPGVAEHRDRQVGRAIHHQGMLSELGRRSDEAAEADNPLHPVEVAAAGRLQMHQDIDEAQPRGFLRLLDRNAPADLAGDRDLAVDRRHLAGDDDQVAGDDVGHIVRDRRHRPRQGDAEFRQFRLDLTGHGLLL